MEQDCKLLDIKGGVTITIGNDTYESIKSNYLEPCDLCDMFRLCYNKGFNKCCDNFVGEGYFKKKESKE